MHTIFWRDNSTEYDLRHANEKAIIEQMLKEYVLI
jgi:hypothetical protein